MSTIKLRIQSAWEPACESEIRVSTTDCYLFQGGPIATLDFGSGAANFRTYATRAELEQLSTMLLFAAAQLEQRATLADLITDWAAA